MGNRIFTVLICSALGAGWANAASASPEMVGCSDNTREGFASLASHPNIASCAGGWTVPGIYSAKSPTCNRNAGNSTTNSVGQGCATEDLCARGWHICASPTEVQAKSPSGCGGSVSAGSMFFATRQSGPGDSHCGGGTNDVFGCGTLGHPIYGTGCGVLNRFSHNNCQNLPAPWRCHGETIEALNVTKPGSAAGGVLCCKDRDSDGDGLPDSLEDHNMDNAVDPGETDPKKRDTDGDGLQDGEEDANLNGKRDRGETDPTRPDSDGDGLTDGIERGRRPDGKPISGATLTNPLATDTDKDGLGDALEDANKNGVVDKGSETSPKAADTDGDGLPDGCIDTDKNGCTTEDGEDLNLNGKQDGTETDPRRADTDGGGVKDGKEVRVDGTDPLLAVDDYTCEDGVRSGLETDVDCGGAVCSPCDNGQGCTRGEDCDSGICDAETKRCTTAQCDDGIQNGDETDVDCGGSCPNGCDNGQGCGENGDCTSGICDDSVSPPVCRSIGCSDGIKNGDETDVDCGGSCKPCDEGQQCKENPDCVTTQCDPDSGKCLPLCPEASNQADCDLDGLRNEIEDSNRNGVIDEGETDPLEADTDSDGLKDGIERGVKADGTPIDGAFNSDPLEPDTDGDALSDGHEDSNLNGVKDDTETDPTQADTDGDGLSDGAEVSIGTDPLEADTDSDGLEDGIELGFGPDGETIDGAFKSNPLEPDTDGDALSDGHEDSNLNGVKDDTETDPTQADTDRGGVPDGTEVTRGTDPLDPLDDFATGGDGGGPFPDGGVGDGGSDALGIDLQNARVVGGGCAMPGGIPGALGLPLLLLGLLLLRRGARRRCGSGASATIVGLLLLLGLTPQAQAQVQGFSVLRMRPAASPLNLYNTERGQTLPHLSPSVGFYMHYDGQPLQMVDANNQPLFNQVDYQFNMSLLAAFGLWDRAEIGLALPVTFTQNAGDRDPGAPAAPSLSGGVGDLRLIPKVRLYTVRFFTISAAVLLDLPTGNTEAFLGDDGVGAEPRAIFAFDWDIVGLALNVGVRFRPNQRIAMAGGAKDIVVGTEMYTSAGGRVGLWRDKLDAVVDGQAFFPLEATSEAEHGGEILGGLRGYLPYGLTANVGAGPGLGSALGVPAFRVLAGLHYQYVRDKPQVVAAPVGDTDGDGKADNVDKCPQEPEDRDGFEDDDGCPDPDNDKDGLLDGDDKCPLFAEDLDGFEDEDGCPDEDNDGDGVLDKDDQCPNRPETVNGVEDDDGCPDEGTGPVQLKHDRITVPPVHFATNGVKVLATSHPTLEMVAKLIQDNPWIKKVRIEGHTDSQGSDAYNQDLSERRAAAIQQFLISLDVDPDRLLAVGLGESRPITTNKTAEGRARNRRVGFFVIDPPMDKSITE